MKMNAQIQLIEDDISDTSLVGPSASQLKNSQLILTRLRYKGNQNFTLYFYEIFYSTGQVLFYWTFLGVVNSKISR